MILQQEKNLTFLFVSLVFVPLCALGRNLLLFRFILAMQNYLSFFYAFFRSLASNHLCFFLILFIFCNWAIDPRSFTYHFSALDKYFVPWEIFYVLLIYHFCIEICTCISSRNFFSVSESHLESDARKNVILTRIEVSF